MTDDKRSGILRKIQALLNKAESTTFAAERDALLGKVDTLMTEYAVNEWELEQQGTIGEIKPELGEFLVCEAGNDLWYDLTDLCSTCVQFFGGKVAYNGLAGKGRYDIKAKVVGFPEDLKNIELMYVSLRLQMAAKLEPSYDPDLSIEENVQAFKEGGFKWVDIWDAFYRGGCPLTTTKEPNRSKLIGWQKKYKEYCATNSIDPVTTNPKNYKVNFAAGFSGAIANRVWEIVMARRRNETAQQAGGTSSSTALVLASREERVDEAFKVFFPKLGRSVSRGKIGANAAAASAGRKTGNKADLGNTRVGNTRGAIE